MNTSAFPMALAQQAELLRALLLAEQPPTAPVDVARLAAYRWLLVDRALKQRHVGVGSLVDCFPLTFAAWQQQHPDDVGYRGLAQRFVRSPAYRTAGGVDQPCVEEAFGRFACDQRIASKAVVTREMVRAVLTAVVAIAPAQPRFSLPREMVRRPSGALVAVLCDGRGRPELLAMAVQHDTRSILTGVLTPGMARVLTEPNAVVPPAVSAALAERGL